MHQSQWRTATVSVRGSKNEARQYPCQDASASALLPKLADDAFIAAIADGVGSAPLADTGSRLAALAARDAAIDATWRWNPDLIPEHFESILYRSLTDARHAVEAEAHRLHRPASDLATTLTVLIHAADTIAIASVGDGAVIVCNQVDQWTTLCPPKHGEYINETTAITSRRAIQNAQIVVASSDVPLMVVAATTDGLINLSLDSRTDDPHVPFFSQIATWLQGHPPDCHWSQNLKQLLASQRVRERTDDDTTLFIATR